jgi:hypothetical protein
MVSSYLELHLALSLDFASADSFLLEKIQHKLKYWLSNKHVLGYESTWWQIAPPFPHFGILSTFQPQPRRAGS